MSRAHTKKHRIIFVLNYLWRRRLSKTWLCIDVKPHDKNNNLIVVRVKDIRIFKTPDAVCQIYFNTDVAELSTINERIQLSVDKWLLSKL